LVRKDLRIIAPSAEVSITVNYPLLDVFVITDEEFQRGQAPAAELTAAARGAGP
jgi:hypothetical protein